MGVNHALTCALVSEWPAVADDGYEVIPAVPLVNPHLHRGAVQTTKFIEDRIGLNEDIPATMAVTSPRSRDLYRLRIHKQDYTRTK